MAIEITDITSVITAYDDLEKATGTYDRMMLAVRSQLNDAVEKQEITQAEAGAMLAQSIPSIMGNAVQFELQRETVDKQLEILEAERIAKQYEVDILLPDQHTTNAKQQALLDTEEEAKQYEVNNLLPEALNKAQEEVDLLQTQESEMVLNGISSRANKDENTAKLAIETAVAAATKQDKIDSSATALDITIGTKQYKIDAALYAANKANFEALYVSDQNTAMNEQVIDNRKIKALDSLADTYGTFGAGGITLSAEMWKTYFDIVVSLAGGSPPTSTTVSKVA